MRAPPTAAEPVAPDVACVAMARRKNSGLSSIALEHAEDQRAEPLGGRRVVGHDVRDGLLQAVVHRLARRRRASSSRLAKYT